MRELVKIILIVVGVLAVLAYLVLDRFVDSFSGTRQRFDIVSQDKTSKLYIKTENWGLTGDHQLTVITTDSDTEIDADSTTEIIFHGLDPFFFRQSGDTLFLYLDKGMCHKGLSPV